MAPKRDPLILLQTEGARWIELRCGELEKYLAEAQVKLAEFESMEYRRQSFFELARVETQDVILLQ